MPLRLETGIHLDVAANDYFADPCSAPSLTQSIAKILLDQSPLHAWHAHPRLNPDFRPDDDSKYDVGNAAHALLIGRGKELVVFDAPDWNATGMGKGSKTELHAKRDAARAEGKVAVLQKTVARANRMVDAAREQLKLRELDHLFRDGDGEAVMVWREGPLHMRQMCDWLTPDRRIYADYKSTDMSAAPGALGRMMMTAGWPIQAAMAERGLDVLDPKGAGRRRYLFVVQEASEPYCLNVVEIGEAALTMGRKRLQIAVDLWRECVRTDRWPGYRPEIVRPEVPGWAEASWLADEVEHEQYRAALPRSVRDAANIGAG